jgi:hypothetical protein
VVVVGTFPACDGLSLPHWPWIPCPPQMLLGPGVPALENDPYDGQPYVEMRWAGLGEVHAVLLPPSSRLERNLFLERTCSLIAIARLI